MKCSQTQARWAAYLDRALDERERQQVADHVRDCRPCESEYQALLAAESVLQRYARNRVRAPAGLVDRLMEKLDAAPRPSIVRELWKLAAVAAVMLVVFGVIVQTTSVEPVVEQARTQIEDARAYVVEELPRAVSTSVSAVWKGRP